MKFYILSTVEKILVINLVFILTDLVSYLSSPFQDYCTEFSISQHEQYQNRKQKQQQQFNFETNFHKSQVEQFENDCLRKNDAKLNSWIKGEPRSAFILLASAKGVAGIGKVSGDGTGGSDKVGQQVPAEVYNALSYAGTAFLFTLSAPLILYGLNKLCNKVEDCFGCGPSSKEAKKVALGELKLENNSPEKQLQTQRQQPQPHQQQHLQSEQNQQQQLQQQQHQQQQQQHQKLQSELQKQLSISNHNGNILINQLYNHYQQQQQKQNIHATPPNSTSIVLPFDLELDCKTAQGDAKVQTQAQGNFQQPPFIISSPNI